MPHISLPGSPPVVVHLRRSARARRLSLRVSQLDGRVTLTLPQRADEREAADFARSKADWIRKHLARRPTDEEVTIGSTLPIEGQMHRVVAGDGRAVTLSGLDLIVAPDAPARRIKGFLTELARDRLVTAADRYADRLGRGYDRITLRDTRSRWGSCSTQGRLMFSWRLIMAPPDVLDYVAAHEVAHLQEMHHGPSFWDTVDRIFGDCKEERRWLHQNAGQLHRYRF